MKYKIAILLFIIGFGFVGTGCKDKSELKDIFEKIKKANNDKDEGKSFDCPDLELNYKDACKTETGKVGYVDKNCDCVTKTNTDKNYDCPDLKLNYKDACKTKDGKVGYVDKNCDCVTK